MAEQTSRLAIIIDSTGAEKNTENLTTALHGLTEWGQKAAASAGKVKKATEEEAGALSNLLDRIDPVNAALNKLDAQQKELAKFKAKGFIDTDTFDAYSKKIEDSRGRLTGFSDQLSKTGMSAKQTAAAMRMVPAQMTDIVVSLAAGQAPITVLLQQGGQLKDMFGGIGPAAKALGGYVAGLINPFTLAAAAVGVLGLAYYKGSEEQSAFNESLILTGNLVGKTSGQLALIASSVSAATNTTTGNAAAVLNQLVSAGKVAGDSLQTVTSAIVSLNKETGIATDQFVADFGKLAKDPINAIAEINEKYNFLTLATYRQIKALQEEGNTQEAARVATEEYASTLSTRAAQIHTSLGTLETSWNAITGAAKSAWDAMLDVGRQKTPESRLAELNERVAEAQKAQSEGGLWNNFNSKFINLDAMIKARDELQSQVTAQEALDESIDSYNKRQQKSIEAQKLVNSLTEQTLSNEQKRKKEQDKLTRAIKDGAEISKEEEARLRKNIDEKYKDPKTAKGKAYTENAATRLVDQLNQQYASLTLQLDTNEKIGSSQQALIKWEQQLADIKTKKTLTADQKSLLANQEAITAQLQKNAALEKEIAIRKDAEKLTAYKNTLSSGLQNDAVGLQNSLNSNTVLSQEQKRQQELTKITTEYQKKQVELTNQRTTGQISQSLYDQETAALQTALNQRLAMQRAYYTQLDQMNGNWQLGVQNGLQSYINSVPTLYESVTSATSSILTSTENAISSNLSAMVKSTESLSDGLKNMAAGMGTAVIDALTKMAAQWLVYQAVQLVVGKTAAAGASSSMIAQATAMSQIAAINAYASAAAIPIVGWTLAPAAMAAAQATTAPFIAAVAASSAAMTAGAGFKSGGYTGGSSVNEVRGPVHGKEYVFDAAATKRIGVSNLEALRNGGSLDATLSRPGYGTGATNVSNSNQNSTTNHNSFSFQQSFTGKPDDATLLAINASNQRMAKQLENKLTAEIIKPQGKFGNALMGNYPRGRRT
ncbi:phage tail length tape measure family protein [Pectobacterium odoriferum]|uniref:phage tail length tape measure family protein n=1 Tax=Pectobacterium odoriferum TaxID=78398 RepID=UPI0005084B80|nr:phage tail length tape measure family protein [Pectobacterium odoriferum]KGA31113.1 lambda family phage tail tape measure protein [Pectobacterium odoriferum]